jgi:DNA-binding CsgD family transcriptional regulator
LFFGTGSGYAAGQDVDSVFVALDNVILRKQSYNQTKDLELSLLRTRLMYSRTPHEKMENSLNLGDAWLSYQNDSAMHYARISYELAEAIGDERGFIEAAILRANIFRAFGQFVESSKLLDEAQRRGIPEDIRYKFLNVNRLKNSAQRGNAVLQTEKDIYRSNVVMYRNLLLADPYTPEMLKFIVELERLYAEGEHAAGLELALSKYDAISPGDLGKDPGILDFHISDFYGNLGDEERELCYLAMAAIKDISYSSRNYVSLRKLSRHLYQSDNVDRAYNYMKCHIDDVVACNERFRLLESTLLFLDINKAFQAKETKQKRTIALTMSLLAVAMLLLLVMMFRTIRQKRRANAAHESVRNSNEALAKANSSLEDANRIKVEYIRLYMEQHLNYLSKMESYKKKARKVALVEGTDALLEFAESSMTTKKDLEDFYKHFDATVLNLFPDFISGVNALLMPDQQEILKSNRELTPGLRIFALIRLGITNSVDIARFLQYSLSTIYTYRTRMRNRAISRQEFETQIMKIGINNE